MRIFWNIVIAGILAVLVFDTIASFASVSLGFPYVYASVGSIIIYCTIGYATYRYYSLFKAITAALLVELVDATLGWYISWVIGPGALPPEQTSITIIGITIIMVLGFAAACSLIGSGIARLLHGSKNA